MNDTTRAMRDAALGADEVAQLMPSLQGWAVEGGAITKRFRFRDYHETMAFVNALAWIAHRTDHHPELTVGYSECRVSFSTHSAGGLTRKDFICAAKVDALISI